jgi:hypothetical protein
MSRCQRGHTVCFLILIFLVLAALPIVSAAPSVHVSCSPGPNIDVGTTSTCTATVNGAGSNPHGSISWTTSGSGTFSSTSCNLPSSGRTCSVTYTPNAPGSHTITGTWSGGGGGYYGSDTLNVGGGGGGGKVDFRQCANNDSPYSLGECHWIGSILQQSNSKYFEGMSVPQRVILIDISATLGDHHNLTFSHESTKGGIHA